MPELSVSFQRHSLRLRLLPKRVSNIVLCHADVTNKPNFKDFSVAGSSYGLSIGWAEGWKCSVLGTKLSDVRLSLKLEDG